PLSDAARSQGSAHAGETAGPGWRSRGGDGWDRVRREVPSRSTIHPPGQRRAESSTRPRFWSRSRLKTLANLRIFRKLAERVGFEPTCRLPDNTLSRRARYDHFGTSP